MKFSDSFLDEIRARLPVSQVVSRRVPLKRAGREWKGLSPFNKEKTPSFTVNDQKGFYHCFSSGKHGDVFTFIMETEGLSFPEAVERLAGDAGLELPKPDPQFERTAKERLGLYDALEAAAHAFEEEFMAREGREALLYAERRGLARDTLKEFRIGFAPNAKDTLKTALLKKGFTEAQLLEAGLVIKPDDGRPSYDRFRNRLTIPILDAKSRIIAFGARTLEEGAEPKYLNSPETRLFDKGSTVFNFARARKAVFDQGELIVVEGYMDVLALAQYGIHNAVATLGTAVTPDHLERLFKVCPQLVFCFDGDTAGQNAAWRALEIALALIRDGRRVYFMFMPEGEDPDSYVRRYGPEKFTDTASYVPLSDYLLDTLRQNIDVNTREGRALLAEKSFPLLGKLPAGALLELLIKDLSVLCQLPPDSIKELVRGKSTSTGPKKAPRNISRTVVKGHTSLVSKAVSRLLQHPGFGLDPTLMERLDGIDDQGVDFLRELLHFISSHPDTTCAGILEHWRDTKYEQRLKELAVMENLLAEIAADENAIKTEFMDYISKIEENSLKRQREIQTQKISSLDDFRQLFGEGGNTQKKGQT